MPAAYFKPVGRNFIMKYNDLFNVQPPWDPAVFGKYCLGYFVYVRMGSKHNICHPGFMRTADGGLQVTWKLRRCCRDVPAGATGLGIPWPYLGNVHPHPHSP